MAYTEKEKRKLANRQSRLRGQVEAMRVALGEDANCTALLQQATACCGALDGFIATVIEHHVRTAGFCERNAFKLPFTAQFRLNSKNTSSMSRNAFPRGPRIDRLFGSGQCHTVLLEIVHQLPLDA